jgi:Uma2 family endonuclease
MPHVLRMTIDEYLRYDRADPWKNEYDDGVVYPVPSAGRRHNLILAGLLAALGNYLPAGCLAYASRMKVRVERPTRILYPDATVVCGASEVAGDGDDEMLLNPNIVFELRSRRLDHYSPIESLREYVFVSTSEYLVEHFERDGDQWRYSVAQGIDATLFLPAASCELPLNEIYHQVDLSA